MTTYYGRRIPDADGYTDTLSATGVGYTRHRLTAHTEQHVTAALPHVVYHSPSGYNWGYLGSGPSDLALSILAHHLGERIPSRGHRERGWESRSLAWVLHHDFKRDHVSTWGDQWEITSAEIDDWLMEHQAEILRVDRENAQYARTQRTATAKGRS